MKKSLLVMAACMMTAAASAQISVKDVEMIQQKSLPTLFDMKYFKVADEKQTPARTKSSGAYYKRPAGAYYGGFGLNVELVLGLQVAPGFNAADGGVRLHACGDELS